MWDESRSRQAAALGRVRFEPRDLGSTLGEFEDAVVRPAAGVAYTPRPGEAVTPGGRQQLVDRIVAELDPRGVLAA